MKGLNIKTILITLAATAVFLGIATFFVVFFSGGNYIVATNVPLTGGYATSTTLILPTSTASSSNPTSGPSSGGGNPSASFSSDFSNPPVTWREGGETLAITNAAYDGNELTLTLQITMGTSPECVPMNLRRVADESGAMAPPETASFSFPGSISCEGNPGAIYNGNDVVFTVDPNAFPLLLTTGGASNIFFNVETSTDGGLDVSVPQTQG